MGLIRGGLFVIASVLLFIVFLAGNLFLTLSMSLEYNNIQKELPPIVKDYAEEKFQVTNTIENELGTIQAYCQNTSEYVFSEQGHTFVVPCEIISQGPEAIVNNEINKLIEQKYYQDYTCGFLECISQQETAFFLISEKAKNYWLERLYFSLISALVLILLMFLLIEKKTNLPLVVGSLLLIASLPFIKLSVVISLIPVFIEKTLVSLLGVLVKKSYNVFLISAIVGLIILGSGIILKFFKIGFKIFGLFGKKDKKFSKEEVRTIVKEEFAKSSSSKRGQTEEFSKAKEKSEEKDSIPKDKKKSK